MDTATAQTDSAPSATADSSANSSWEDFLRVVLTAQHEIVVEDAEGNRYVLIPETRFRALQGTEDLTDDYLPGSSSTAPRLTQREQQVLQLAADGYPASAAAKQLGVAVNTIAQHLVAVRRKYGVHSTAAAAVIARRAGIIV